MVFTRSQKQGLNPPPLVENKKKIRKCKRIIIRDFYFRFPKLSEGIFQQIDHQTLVRCKKVDRSWYNCIQNHRIQWIRKIQKLSQDFDEFQKDWDKVVKKTPLKNLKKLTTILETQTNNGFQRSPLHIVAKNGNLDIFKDIEDKFEHINPKCNQGYTPLHLAAIKGCVPPKLCLASFCLTHVGLA